MSFARLARRLSGQAALLLGWRPDDFWQSTPDELADALLALRDTAVTCEGLPPDRAAIATLMEMYPDG